MLLTRMVGRFIRSVCSDNVSGAFLIYCLVGAACVQSEHNVLVGSSGALQIQGDRPIDMSGMFFFL